MNSGGELGLAFWRKKKRRLSENLGADLFADTALDVLVDIAISYQSCSVSIDRLQSSTGLSARVIDRYLTIFEKRNLIERDETDRSIKLTSTTERLLNDSNSIEC